MTWDDNTFPNADDSADVGWLISYWRTVPCESGCHGDYKLESRQFDHLVRAATREEAVAKFQTYVDQKRESGGGRGIKGLTLFLSKVELAVQILDDTGEVIHD